MIAAPGAVDRFVEDALARRDLERRATVLPAADQDVVDPLERLIPVGHVRVLRGEGVARLARVRALPGVAVTDAHPVQRLLAGPEADAGRVWRGVEVACHDHVPFLADEEFFDRTRD